MGEEAEGVGGRIRRERLNRNWTLSQMAERSGVSVGTLSKIENGLSTPYFDTILKIARTFGVDFETLIEPASSSPASARCVATHRGEGVAFSTGMYDYEVHAANLVNKSMIPLYMTIHARSLLDITNWSSHEGEEIIFVVSGEVALHTEHYAPIFLKAGESAYIDSRMRHAFVCHSPEPARMLSICLSDGKDLAVGVPDIGKAPDGSAA